MNDQGQNAPSIGAIFQESVDEVVDALRRAAPKLRRNASRYVERQLEIKLPHVADALKRAAAHMAAKRR